MKEQFADWVAEENDYFAEELELRLAQAFEEVT